MRDGRQGWSSGAARACAALGLLCAWPGAALAAEVKPLGRFDDWGAFVVEDGANKHCFARSVPSSGMVI